VPLLGLEGGRGPGQDWGGFGWSAVAAGVAERPGRLPDAWKPQGARFTAHGALDHVGRHGLTCASFVAVLFESANAPLIELSTWHQRDPARKAEDDAAQQRLVDALAARRLQTTDCAKDVVEVDARFEGGWHASQYGGFILGRGNPEQDVDQNGSIRNHLSNCGNLSSVMNERISHGGPRPPPLLCTSHHSHRPCHAASQMVGHGPLPVKPS
jgi:hypothetical protein